VLLRRWLPAGLIVLLLAGVVVVVVTYPVVAAAVCPRCHGLRKAAPGVYVGGGDANDSIGAVNDSIAAARRRVRDYFGDLRSDPEFLVCRDADCYRRIGGGREKGRTLRHSVIILSPDGANETIAGHELTHAEMHRRLDDYDKVPRWFQEGFAVVVSQDSRYLPCPVDYAGALERVRAGTSARQDFYRDSACVADRWVAEHGGKSAVLDLIRRLNAGESPRILDGG
jgi:hypothetical protein